MTTIAVANPNLVETIAKSLARAEHPRTPWPDELIASINGNYRLKTYRERYRNAASVLINTIGEALAGIEPKRFNEGAELFAAKIAGATAERERCAAIADKFAATVPDLAKSDNPTTARVIAAIISDTGTKIAATIRDPDPNRASQTPPPANQSGI